MKQRLIENGFINKVLNDLIESAARKARQKKQLNDNANQESDFNIDEVNTLVLIKNYF